MADEGQRPVERSIWSYVAPAVLLAAITILVLIADSAGWFGRDRSTTPTPSPPSPPAVTTSYTDTGESTTGTVATTDTTDTTDTTETTDTTATTDTTETTDTAGADTTGQTTIKVTVAKGDTLNAIALRTNTTVARLLELNPGIDPQALTIGQEIVVG